MDIFKSLNFWLIGRLIFLSHLIDRAFSMSRLRNDACFVLVAGKADAIEVLHSLEEAFYH